MGDEWSEIDCGSGVYSLGTKRNQIKPNRIKLIQTEPNKTEPHESQQNQTEPNGSKLNQVEANRMKQGCLQLFAMVC